MAKNSNIEWTDHTFNPWIGCAKVSAGCKHCYAETLMDKRYKRVKWGPAGQRVRTSAANWRKPLAWNREAKEQGRRAKVFCASLADVFEHKPDQQPEMDQWRYELFKLIIDTPHLDWLLLTKRPASVNPMIEHVTGFSASHMWFHAAQNVRIGTSFENQEQANKRLPALMEVPAPNFVSCEPILGPVDLTRMYVLRHNKPVNMLKIAGCVMHAPGHCLGDCRWRWPGLGWVIVGGESGTDARPMHPKWARDIRDDCVDAGVPFLFKQWGRWLPFGQSAPDDDGTWCPPGRIIRAYQHNFQGIGKKLSGRLLDGREWNQFPNVQP
jgi:protein gp37